MNATLCQTPLLCFLISLTYGNGVRMLFDCLVVSLTLRKNFHVHDRSSIRDRWCTYMTGQVYTWLVMYVDWWYTYMTGHVSNGFETHEAANGWWLVMYQTWLVVYVHDRSCISRFRDAWGRKGSVTGDVRTWPVMYQTVSRRMRP